VERSDPVGREPDDADPPAASQNIDPAGDVLAAPPSSREANAAPEPSPQDPSQRDDPFSEADLPPDFWDQHVSFDDLAPADCAPSRGAPEAPAAERDHAGAAVRPAAPVEPGGAADADRGRNGADSDSGDPPADDDPLGSSEAATEDTFAALRQLFPGRILNVEPLESADDLPTAEDAGSGAGGGPVFDGSDDADGAGIGVD
jgi:hypothetical protein